MEIVYKALEDIKPYENNPRYNEEAIDEVKKSIRDFGFKVPIVLDKNNVIVAGHTRYEASKRLGLEKVPCIIAKDLSEDKIKAFRLADNRVAEFSTWDYEKLDEELQIIKQIDMSIYGFLQEGSQIDWNSIEEITEETYEEPDRKTIVCPYCNHEDKQDRFKKVKSK